MVLTKVPTSSTYVLMIDDRVAGSVRKVAGGVVRTAIVDQPVGPNNLRIRHTSVADIEPLSLEIGVLQPVLTWARDALNRKFDRRNLSIYQGAGSAVSFEIDGMNCLLTEITMPALDRTASADAFIRIKIQPESERMIKLSAKARPMPIPPPAGGLSGSDFSLIIDGVLDGKEAQKVDSFTIKTGVKKLYTGAERYPELEPTKTEFPNLVVTVQTNHAEALLKWFDQTRADATDRAAEKSGRLEYYSRGKTVAFAINLSEVGLQNVQAAGSVVKAELWCGRMQFDGAQLGLQ